MPIRIGLTNQHWRSRSFIRRLDVDEPRVVRVRAFDASAIHAGAARVNAPLASLRARVKK